MECSKRDTASPIADRLSGRLGGPHVLDTCDVSDRRAGGFGDDERMADSVPLRRPRFGWRALTRMAGYALLSGYCGALMVGLGGIGSGSWFFYALGSCFLAWAFLELVPLVGRRHPGTVSFSSNGVTITAPTFLRAPVQIPWSRIDRITTTAVGDGTVLDVQVVAPALVLVLRPGDRRIPGVRWRSTLLAAALSSRRAVDHWRPPTRANKHERLALNLDCEPNAAEQLTQQWDSVVPRHHDPATPNAATSFRRDASSEPR